MGQKKIKSDVNDIFQNYIFSHSSIAQVTSKVTVHKFNSAIQTKSSSLMYYMLEKTSKPSRLVHAKKWLSPINHGQLHH